MPEKVNQVNPKIELCKANQAPPPRPCIKVNTLAFVENCLIKYYKAEQINVILRKFRKRLKMATETLLAIASSKRSTMEPGA